MIKIFFDTEFTGLHKKTSLISIGLISENGYQFYAEFKDYDRDQIDSWLEKNVIANTKFLKDYRPVTVNMSDKLIEIYDTKANIKDALEAWLRGFGVPLEMWSDCLAYDWVLFNDIFGTAFDIPENVNYIPFDICTMFKLKDIDPDIHRESFVAGRKIDDPKGKHNALADARIIMECHKKLTKVTEVTQ